MKQGSLLYPWF